MKASRLITLAMFAAVTLAVAGPVYAGSGKGAGHASAARSAGSVGGARAEMGRQSSFRGRNRRFLSQSFASFGYGGYGYGNQVYLNPDEADWGEQWQSLREDNDGPYAKSTFEGNPQGEARMWVFSEDEAPAKPSK
ncbi:MAG: hypothetical protein WAU82_06500 [Candidatus Binatus sp.]|uniref:hypothetical protein n=1 Tax=Candidatus Binatus sp. TaxID=2811406 RepID=UPI003BB17213